MINGLRNFLEHTWWHSQSHAKTWFDVVYPCFNMAEGIAWLLVAALVLWRSMRNGWTTLELRYAALWMLFAATDFREAWAQQTWLILVKGIILGLLLWLRRKVLRRYPQSRAF